jgi:hypothetical protein
VEPVVPPGGVPPVGVETPPPPEESRPVAGGGGQVGVVAGVVGVGVLVGVVGVGVVVVGVVVVGVAPGDPQAPAARLVVSLLTTVRPVGTAGFAGWSAVFESAVVDWLVYCLVDLLAVEVMSCGLDVTALCLTAA